MGSLFITGSSVEDRLRWRLSVNFDIALSVFSELSCWQEALSRDQPPKSRLEKPKGEKYSRQHNSLKIDSVTPKFTNYQDALSIETHSKFRQRQYSLHQMQNRFASELSLQQALRDLTNVVKGRLHLDWRPQVPLGYHLREPGQVFRKGTEPSARLQRTPLFSLCR